MENPPNPNEARSQHLEISPLVTSIGPHLPIVAAQACATDMNTLRISQQCAQYFNIPMTNRHIHRISEHINTSLKLTSVALELKMSKSQVDPFLENYKNIVEASLNFLMDWKNQRENSESAWKEILFSLWHAEVFPSTQELIEFCATLFNI